MHDVLIKLNILFFAVFFSIDTFAITNDHQSVDKLVHTFIKAYEKQDLNTILKLYASESLAIGTGSDEAAQGKKQISDALKRDFAEHTDATISAEKIAMHIRNNSAIASYYLIVNVNVKNSAPFQSKLRFTVGLEKEHNHWLITQSHLSAPLEAEKKGESFPHPHA